MANKWALLQGGRVKYYDSVEDVYRALKNWSPLTAALLATPRYLQFVPPTSCKQLAPRLIKRYQTRYRICLGLSVVSTLLVLVSAILLQSPIFFKGTFLFFLITVAIFTDYRISFHLPKSVHQRTVFFYWLFNHKAIRKNLAGWLLFIVSLALFQLAAQYFVGGRDPLLHYIGTIHAHVMHGEVWRLFTGPLLHSSILHFLSNTLFLLLIGPLAWYLYSYKTVGVFLLASTLGALVSTLLGTYTDNYSFDSYAGLSPSIFALFGLVSVSGVLDKRLLPPGIALHLGFIAIISIVTASVYINNTANFSHWAGLLFGMALAPRLKGKKIELSEVTELNVNLDDGCWL